MTSNQKNSPVSLKVALTVSLILLAVSISVSASLYSEKSKACKNYAASLRILEKMSERMTDYALQNRQLTMKTRTTPSGDAVAFVR